MRHVGPLRPAPLPRLALPTVESGRVTWLRHIVIVGGGTAGWMVAAALGRMLGVATTRISLVESSDIATIGVGEATIPPIVAFNRMLGIDEAEFVRETAATAKLGIEFVNWGRLDHRYFHPFDRYGADFGGLPFPHFWLRARRLGLKAPIDAFNVGTLAARAGKCAIPGGKQVGAPPYAYHFDAGLYGDYLRGYAGQKGVVRVEGRVTGVVRTEEGSIEALRLADGRSIEGDFFIDCSGFRALLIEGALDSPFEDWSRWLPVNRAVVAPSRRMPALRPITRSTAREAGWQWRIPLQHRTGNGYVFCDAFLSEAAAMEDLVRDLEGHGADEPRLLRFTTGCRSRQWVGNCVAIGLAAGFLEPLESTSIHLVQAAISKLLAFFPTGANDSVLAGRFNREMGDLFANIRDFLVAHYVLTERNDTEFWRHCRTLPVPDTLAERIASFSARGEVIPAHQDLFRDSSWFAVLHGQGVKPASYHPITEALEAAVLRKTLNSIHRDVAEKVAGLR
ncbi:MAG: tryptophan halogenase family protein [Sphingomonas bacterium]